MRIFILALFMLTIRGSAKVNTVNKDSLHSKCPCYKYQRKAEKEYSKLVKKQESRSFKKVGQKVEPTSRIYWFFNHLPFKPTKRAKFTKSKKPKWYLFRFKKDIAACT